MAELARMGRSEGLPISREERQVARRARQTVTDVQLVALKVDGAVELGKHIMDELIDLDDRRRDLARADPTRNLLLSEIEETTLQQVKKLQRGLFSAWGL